jgi:glycosyltransferase involved in cell wall biosynthesis
MTLEVISSLKQIDRFAGHVDTRDPRPLSTIGRLDFTNVFLGVKYAWRLSRVLAEHPGADVYIPISQSTWGFMRDAVLVGVTKAHRRRPILHLHGGHLQAFYRGAPAIMRWLIRAVFGQAHEAWALTSSLQAQFRGLVDSDRVRCVENVVPDPLTDSDDAGASPEHASFRLLYLANLLPEKGCFELIAALRLLGEACSGWEVRLVGAADPAVEERLRREIALLPSKGPDVRLLGVLRGAEKSAQYRWADAFAYPTYYPFEGQPLVLLEALGSALPIISTRHAGIPDTVRDGIDGLLVEPRDPSALAAALSKLSLDESLRANLAHAARCRYESTYRPERLTRDLEAALTAP